LLEVHTPFLFDVKASPSRNLSKYRYGQVFGDIGFMLPLEEEYINHVWQYVPLGIPYFSIGMKF
jgi:hypothetical protein